VIAAGLAHRCPLMRMPRGWWRIGPSAASPPRPGGFPRAQEEGSGHEEADGVARRSRRGCRVGGGESLLPLGRVLAAPAPGWVSIC
jgi:hypothetical protein